MHGGGRAAGQLFTLRPRLKRAGEAVMGRYPEDDGEETYSMDSAATRLVCEECGYKWRVEAPDEEVDEEDNTVSYDTDSNSETPACPMCGCSNVISL